MAHEIMAADSMFSVREMPWHGLGAVLDEYPDGIDDALEKSGLTWQVKQGDVFVARPIGTGGLYVPSLESDLVPAEAFKANIREDTGDVLGIVSNDYSIVPNRDAFQWLNDLLGSELEFETAGSLNNGRRVWVLAKVPQVVEIGGDSTVLYIYCANSHDGSMAVTAAGTKVRIVCGNTLGWALRQSEASGRVYKFRHTGNMQEKLGEARRAMQVVLDWDTAFKNLGDELARQPMRLDTFDNKVVKPLLGLDGDLTEMGKRARNGREKRRELLRDIFVGAGPDGDTSGNSPRTKWSAANAVAEYADFYRRYTKTTDQVARSFEDQSVKDKGLELVRAA